jgi:hypothetical protein
MAIKYKDTMVAITVNGHDIEVKIIRTHRLKTASIHVINGIVSIRVPSNLSSSRVLQIIESKRSWISKKWVAHENREPKKELRLINGDTILFLGKNYRLNITQGDHQSVKTAESDLWVTLPTNTNLYPDVKKALTHWYIEQAEQTIALKVTHYAELVGVKPSKIQIKTYKSQWGSCNDRGDLRFNWLIIMAADSVINYVIIHELCHLLQMNHSPDFWREVARVMPDYVKHHQWLKKHGHQLVF